MSPVKRLRIRKGLSRKDLAERLLITKEYLGAIERGERKARISLLARLANELDVSINKLAK